MAISAICLLATITAAAAQECAAVTITPRGTAQCLPANGDFAGQANPSWHRDGTYTDAPRYIPPQQCTAGAACN
jgi:hypothetical protein